MNDCICEMFFRWVAYGMFATAVALLFGFAICLLIDTAIPIWRWLRDFKWRR